VFLTCGANAHAQPMAELEDATARIQYAFFTNDVRALEEVLAILEDSEVAPSLLPLKSYHLAYGHWKLAQLYSEQAERSHGLASSATKAAKRCVEQSRSAVKQDPAMAEAHALQAVCEDKPRSFMRLSGLNSGSCERSKSLRSATSLAPENPRVMLIVTLCARASDSVDVINRWRKVVHAFEAAPVARAGAPDWGQAEALTLFGEALLKDGKNVAARDAIEQALVIAPDYEAAKSLLQAVATQSR